MESRISELQSDYLDSDPQFYTNDDYAFHIDITLPSVNMIPLYDDIFSENFDLYMLGSERLVDFGILFKQFFFIKEKTL